MNRQFREEKYLRDFSFLKLYDNQKIKLVTCSCVRNSGVEDDEEKRIIGVNESKLACNVARAKSRVTELALCNDWDYFVTLTASKSLVERYNLQSVYYALQRVIHNERRIGHDIKYLFVPEQHKDGAWHLHGFISGAEMRPFCLDDKPPKYVRVRLKSGLSVFDWTAYSKAVGYTVCEPIRNKEAASRYVSKYITKVLAKAVNGSGEHLYYCSKGLKRAVQIKKGRLESDSFQNVCAVPTGVFCGEHAIIRWYDYSPELLRSLSAALL